MFCKSINHKSDILVITFGNLTSESFILEEYMLFYPLELIRKQSAWVQNKHTKINCCPISQPVQKV